MTASFTDLKGGRLSISARPILTTPDPDPVSMASMKNKADTWNIELIARTTDHLTNWKLIPSSSKPKFNLQFSFKLEFTHIWEQLTVNQVIA
ncbi:uncharacterized protein G2W53_041567 [Senna tora]|uniref:Uncharacterized protein n=1 Tax=Senna tora TaxID=362788 RepID=A0A834SF94_9FABA|nr:uncharacterized protein G2W53_041567 [Senna tora]